ncbi:glycosyltransferase family 39 protein, partial [bacterium]|nr:glycosyltransferase family 39 protein [bacterium]
MEKDGAKPPLAFWPLMAIALLQMLVHFMTNGNYGMFRDEFYYIACAEHLAWGYVDHPPFSMLMLAISKAIFGDSVQAIRLLATISGGVLILMVGHLAREMGGNKIAQIIAATAMLISPTHLGLTGFYSMNSFDFLFWMGAIWIVVRIVNTGNDKLWLLFGIVIGLGLQNKLSVLFLAMGLVAAMLLSPLRKYLSNKYFWIGSGLAILIFLPHILWQIANGWPTLEFMANAKQYKIADISPWEFFSAQIMDNHPLNFLIWFGGLLFLLIAKSMRPYRILGIAVIVIFLFFIVQKSKPYYFAPAIPFLIAVGGIMIGNWLTKRNLNWLAIVLVISLLLGGAWSAPLAVPFLPPDKFADYSLNKLVSGRSAEVYDSGVLPQHFADRFGWEELAKATSMIYLQLTPEEQANCAVFGHNYGVCGSLQYFSQWVPLPRVVGGHNNYYLWGPGDEEVSVLLVIGGDPDDHREVFNSVEAGLETVISPYAMGY